MVYVYQHIQLLRGQLPRFSIVIGNTPRAYFPLARLLWTHAQVRVLADGACNLFPSDLPRPHFIVGDLDSALPNKLEYFSKIGTGIVQDRDQDRNDLQKCLDVIAKNETKSNHVILAGVLGGRFDHELAAVNVALLALKHHQFESVTLISHENLVSVLLPGKNVLNNDLEIQGPTCGVIPLGEPCQKITTKGLKWNLHGETMEFGKGIISTSNIIQDQIVEINNSNQVIWTTALNGYLQ